MSPKSLVAKDVQSVRGKTGYPAPFEQVVGGRDKRVLGDLFGLTNFGVNLTTLQPGSASALMHRHEKQDEFVYVLDGEAVLLTPDGEENLTAGSCAGFAAAGYAHQLVNRSAKPMTYLEIGDRTPGDVVEYPDDDLAVECTEDGGFVFSRKSEA